MKAAFLTHCIVNRKALMLGVLLVVTSLLSAQDINQQTLLNIEGEKITAGEFLNIYKKNNIQTDVIDKKSLEEYLDLFINFKLKVKDAENNGLDTVKALREELAGYRRQLAQPYFVDDEVVSGLLKEAYDRMHWDLRACHLLIRCEANAKPADTLAAYKKIHGIRERISKGETFGAMAEQFSDDPSARDREANNQHPFMKGNQGDLGYFTAFNMVYPFETAAYKLKVGEVSMPVRTQFGYHLIKLINKCPALGKVQAAHIYFQIPPRSTREDSLRIEEHVDSVYQKIIAGASYTDMVKQYSDDKGSATRDGVLPWFTSNKLVPSFIDAIYPLTDSGQVAKPVLTTYGWHIIRLVERKPIGNFDELKTELKQQIVRDQRYDKSKTSVISKLKDEYSFTENVKLLKKINSTVNDSIFEGKWKASAASDLGTKKLWSLAGKDYTVSDFAQYLESTQKKEKPEATEVYVMQKFKAMTDEKIMAYEDSMLEKKYPDFRMIMQEYHDGILLFEMTQKKVWEKAVADTTGLEAFYETVKNNYLWDDRKDVSMITIDNLLNEKAATKMVEKLNKTMAGANNSVSELQANLSADTSLLINISRDKLIKSENEMADGLSKAGSFAQKTLKGENGKISLTYVYLHSLIPSEPKALNEIKGLVTAEYQNYLESQWIDELKKMYKVQVDKNVFDKLK
ncbi:MAG: peptidylprolyl isomerase [Bacteroidales bacterium]|nr:peptidylprolyl isomerase [Bacteroidales bacterium]